MDEKRERINPNHKKLSVSRQCALLGLPRSSWYYQSARPESAQNLKLMADIDRQYLKTPTYGVARMTAQLRRDGHQVGPKRTRRLMRKMGLQAIYPRPRLSQPGDEPRRFPYLLKGLQINAPNQVWATDITYIPLKNGYAYLTAVMDWHSRYVVSWELSRSLDSDFCVKTLRRALAVARPAIFNSDQGSQFTSRLFTGVLEASGVQISMDGRGRCFDNIFVERLWRTVKYEEVYLHEYASFESAKEGLTKFFRDYNNTRLHQALGYRTPAEIYFDREAASAV